MLPIRTVKSPILSFYDLKDEDQNEISDMYNDGIYNPEEDQFVEFDYPNGDIKILRISDFMRSKGTRYHGYYTTSNTSGFGIIINRTGENALISLF